MSTAVHHRAAPEIDAEYRAAIARLDADLKIVVCAARDASADTRNMLSLLHRRIVDAYRAALTDAAGRPDDITWLALGATTAAFIACVPHTAIAGSALRAARRLAALARENA